MRHLDPEQSFAQLLPDLAGAVPDELRDPLEDFIAVILRVTQAVPARVANDARQEAVLLPKGTVQGAKDALTEAMGVFFARLGQ